MQNQRIIVLFAIILLMSIIPIKEVSALGLNYKCSNAIVTSGESFCLKDCYYLYTTADKEESGYLDVTPPLFPFLSYANLETEKLTQQTTLKTLNSRLYALETEITTKKNAGEDYSALRAEEGKLDTQIQEINVKIDSLNARIDREKNVTIITVPALDPKIRTQYENNSQGLREYLTKNKLLQPAVICLKAPEIEKEIKGKCYTKYYDGEVVLHSKILSLNGSTGSSVASEVSAPLTIQVRCKSNSITKYLYYGIGAIIIILIIVGIIFFIKKRKKSDYEPNYPNEENTNY